MEIQHQHCIRPQFQTNIMYIRLCYYTRSARAAARAAFVPGGVTTNARFSQSSGTWRRVEWHIRTNVSKHRAVSIFRTEVSAILKIEAASSSETSQIPYHVQRKHDLWRQNIIRLAITLNVKWRNQTRGQEAAQGDWFKCCQLTGKNYRDVATDIWNFPRCSKL